MSYKNLFYFLSACTIYHSAVVSSEFLIKTDTNPTYIEAQFKNWAEEIFPRQILVNVSLTHFGGTLLCSIDANRNQLIVRLMQNDGMFLDLEFRGKPLKIPLSDICGCNPCLYVPLAISITISSVLQLQCNGHQPIKMSFDQTKLLDYDYPTMNLEKTNGQNSAILWLMNTPRYENLYPNPEQMKGCIFNVDVNGSPIYTRAVGDIGSFCKRSCKENICRDGVCYETYADEPICGCCKAFGNGLHCEDESKPINGNFNKNINGCCLKISLKGVTTDTIIILENEHVQLQLKVENSTLYFDIVDRNTSSRESHRLSSYNESIKYVILITFGKTVTIEMPHICNGTMNIPREISQKNLKIVNVTSGLGVIDIAFKRKVSDLVCEKLRLGTDSKSTEAKGSQTRHPIEERTTEKLNNALTLSCSHEAYFFGMVNNLSVWSKIATSLQFVTLIVVMIFVCRKIIKRNRKNGGIKKSRTETKHAGKPLLPTVCFMKKK